MTRSVLFQISTIELLATVHLYRIQVELSDSDGEELDDETVKKIILEAEQSVADVPDEALTKKNVEPASASPTAKAVASPQKKPGLFSKIFRRDGKS